MSSTINITMLKEAPALVRQLHSGIAFPNHLVVEQSPVTPHEGCIFLSGPASVSSASSPWSLQASL